MTYKKTWLSYVIWAIFTCITGVMLANYTILFWTKIIDPMVGLGTVVLVVGVFAVIVGLYLLLRKVIVPITQKFHANERITRFLEAFIVICGFAGGLLYRIYLYTQTSVESITETMYYHQAMVKSGAMVEPMTHGASYLYTLCLSFILSFLGNKVVAGVWLQIVLQMITLILVFCVVRRMVGRVAACVAMMMLAVSSVYVNQIFSLTPENLFFVLYLLGIFLVGSFVRFYTNNQFNVISAVLGALVSGVVIGCLMYFDAIAVSLVILLVGIFSGIRQMQQEERFYKISFSILLFVLSIAAFLLTLMGMFALDAAFCEEKIMTVAEAWFSLYQSYLPMGYILYQTEFSIIECFVQVLIAALLIMSFWNRGKEQNCTPWICFMLLLAPTPLAISGVLSYQVFSIFIWSILAGIGLQQCFVSDAVKVKTESEVKQDVESDEVVHEKIEQEKVRQEEVEQKETKPRPRFIENPLPLPKKHEKKEMDYQYAVTEDKMEFDIEIKENDDFDV